MALNDVQVVEGSNGTVKIVSSNAGKEFAAEEISAQVLRKLVDDASKFLNDKVANMTLPISSSSVRHGHFIRTSVAGTQPKCGFANGIPSLLCRFP